jgi:hypothetical protein
MYAALGKNDQKIYVVPSENLVVVRQGNNAGPLTAAASSFDNQLWARLSDMECLTNTQEDYRAPRWSVAPNPVREELQVRAAFSVSQLQLLNTNGQVVRTVKGPNMNVSGLPAGLYFISVWSDGRRIGAERVVIQ